jgi:hypothetical protein
MDITEDSDAEDTTETFSTCAAPQLSPEKAFDIGESFSLPCLVNVFAFLTESELMRVSLVCNSWADEAALAHVNLMLESVAYLSGNNDFDEEDSDSSTELVQRSSIALSMERPWSYLFDRFPWARFLAEGGSKKVYKVWNSCVESYEAISVMYVNLCVF